MTSTDLNLNDSIEDTPFKGQDSVFVDMSNLIEVEGEALRVELRRTRKPAAGPTKTRNLIPEENYIVGLISPKDLPEEGKNFKMPYYNVNNLSDFGRVDSQEPIWDLAQYEDCYFFTTSEGQWRLKILNRGN